MPIFLALLSACALDIIHICSIEEQQTEAGMRTCIHRDYKWFSNACKAELWFGPPARPAPKEPEK